MALYIDFLDSDTVSLQAGKECRSFNIHRKLLGSKSKAIIAAFDKGFEEGQKGTYTFQHTSEGTLARFIEWAYTGDYPTIIKPTLAQERQSTNVECAEVQNEANTCSTSENHPLLAHIRLYIFCGIYIIPSLQNLAFKKTTACLTELEKPIGLDTHLAVIAVLRMSFHQLHKNDLLLGWLAQYAAYGIEQLRVQKDFHDLLQECPTLSSRMVLSLNPASSPPWRTKEPKYDFEQYSLDHGYEDGYD
ncbi:hypothetical protein BJX70DRAFT_312971 [Aspergillus crustosus]